MDSRQYSARLSFVFVSVLLASLPNLLCAQEAIRWAKPLERAAELLEQWYAVPVTYEDPHRTTMSTEIQTLGRMPDGSQLSTVREHTFVVPPGLTGPGVGKLTRQIVSAVVDAYSQQNPDQARFRVEESATGFHLIPVQFHDAGGALVAAQTPLDVTITVPKASRTASGHFKALCAAVSAASGVSVVPVEGSLNVAYVANGYYVPKTMAEAATPYMLFEWGVETTQARAALIDLLAGSKTTLTWRLTCDSYRLKPTCYLTPTALAVGPKRMVVAYDRCTNCQPMPIDK
jgi:hypothetical protein